MFWIDFGHRLVDEQGLIPGRLMPDYLHLSAAAYEIWADALEDRLSAILGDARIASTAAAGADLSGDWTWTMQGPDGNAIEAPLILRQEGLRITGRFARDDTRWLEIENGAIAGNRFAWTVRRDRPNGETMVYRMSGVVENGAITGKVSTEVDGSEVTSDWSARRR